METRLLTALSLSTLASLVSCSEKPSTTSGEKTAPATSSAPAANAAAPADKEKAFVATFRKALEGKDKKTMDSLLLKDGTPAEIMEFFQMMLELPAGVTVESIELATPTAEEAAKFNSAMEMPDGKSYKLPIIPTKQLVIKMKEGATGTSKSTFPVAEKDGKLVIPMPVAAPK